MKVFKTIREKLKTVRNKMKQLYTKHFIGKLIATVIGLVAMIWFITYIPVLFVKANAIPEVAHKGLSKEIREILLDEGEVMVAESNSKRLYIDSTTMNLKVEDTNTNKVWNSILPGSKESLELALLSIAYLGNDNKMYNWDTYQYCTALKSYKLYQIENGVQIVMHISEGESSRFYEYYPSKMSPERFENFFVAGIEKLIQDGVVEEAIGKKYEQTLKLIYRKSIKENCYAVATNGEPPTSAAKQLIKLAELLGYSSEMLTADAEEFGLTVNFVEPAVFDITVEATLEGDDFIVNVPTQEMVSGNDFYTIQNINVFPNFGTASVEDYNDGYIFVPDGAGALFRFNTYNSAVPDYIRTVYNHDLMKNYYYMPEYGEELMMPVFGMIYGEEAKSDHGFLGIIENGAETSYINVKLASANEDTTSRYNKAYASFDVTQYSNVKVYGPYSDNSATYLADSGKLNVDYKIRYKLFPDSVTYFDMAKSYQEYLMQEWNMTTLDYPEKPKLYLDFVGAISLTKRILGIPYDSSYSMTTYNELIDIIKDLGDKNLALQYSGFFNGGFENKLNNRADLVPVNGSTKKLDELINITKENNIDLFFETSLSKVYDSGNGFSAKKHAIYDYSNAPATLYRYLPSIGILNGYSGFETYYNYLLSPRYLDGVVNKFISDSPRYTKLSVSDLANYTYADYRFNKPISVYQASKIVDNNLKKLAEKRELSLYNPLMKNLIYGNYAEDISRESSNYATMYTTIPFRQIVMNGLIQVTTENVNMSTYSPAYYVLQAVELGVYPKFTLTAQNNDVLKDSAYANLYSTQYSSLKDTIEGVYTECENAWEAIGSMEIVDHHMLQEKVFCTQYASGVSVITNYNLHSVTVNGQEIPAEGYRIVKE